MKRIFCDICGKNIVVADRMKPIYYILKIFGNLSGNVHLSKDICHDCYNKIDNFITELTK